MPQPTRFSYASSSTALPSTIKNHLVSMTRDAESNNARGIMAGILVYGNDNFFHCLEAPASTIDRVYRQAVSNPLDEKFKLLKRELITERYFTGWEIIYFVREEALQQFFVKHYGQNGFDPYLLEASQLDEFIALLAGLAPQRFAVKAHRAEVSELSHSAGRLGSVYYLAGFMLIAALIILGLIFGLNQYLGLNGFSIMYQQ